MGLTLLSTLWEEAGLSFAGIGNWPGLSGQAAGWLARRGRELESSNEDYASRLRRIRLSLGVDRAPFGADSQCDFSF